MIFLKCFFVGLLSVASLSKAWAQPNIEAKPAALTLADPTLFFWEGKYYAFGTSGVNSNMGIPVFISENLLHWKALATNDGFALKKGDAFGTRGFWAPQVFALNDSFYMAYTANEQIALASSKNAWGPFTQNVKAAMPSDGKQIDPFVFMNDDGKKYLFHVRLQKGNRIFAAELKNDLTGIEKNTLVECISATEQWENTGDSVWPVTEGPTVIKMKKKYYMFYSANDFRNPDYAVGLATSNHPLGPWVKHGANPLLSRKQTGLNGTGHGDLIKLTDGTWRYIFHVHHSADRVAPRKAMMIGVTATKSGFVFDENVVEMVL